MTFLRVASRVDAGSLVASQANLHTRLCRNVEGRALPPYSRLWVRGLLGPGFSCGSHQVLDQGEVKLQLGLNVIPYCTQPFFS